MGIFDRFNGNAAAQAAFRNAPPPPSLPAREYGIVKTMPQDGQVLKYLSGVPAPVFDLAITGTQFQQAGGYGGAGGMWAASGFLAQRDPMGHALVSAIVDLWTDTLVPLDFAIRRKSDGVIKEDYEILDLLRDPGHGWSASEFKHAMIEGMICSGNAYALFEHAKSMKVLDWRYTRPPFLGQNYYEYTDPLTMKRHEFEPSQVIHLRWRRGPDGVMGIGPLAGTAAAEMMGDITAMQYTIALLRNMGVPGIVLSPLFESSDISPAEAASMSQALNNTTGRGGQGNAVVLSKPFRIDEMSGVSGIADTRRLRWVPEERICAACKIYAALLGIGTGSEQTRVGATMESLVRLWWEKGVLPMMGHLSEQLGKQLLWRFMDQRRYELVPDVDDSPRVREIRAKALAADIENALSLYHGGLMGWQEANQMAGGDGVKPPDLIAEPTFSGSGGKSLTSGKGGGNGYTSEEGRPAGGGEPRGLALGRE